MEMADSIMQSPTTMIPDSPFHEHHPHAMMTQVAGISSPGLNSPMVHEHSQQDGPGHPKRRRASKAEVLKRSASTPNVRSIPPGETPSSMLNDKKRNKLGYHRTSVACVHCRRRKIRCLLADGDPQNRCSNCIRLKKDCQFYPVDQQPPQETRRRTGSKTEIKSSGNSSSSSSPGFTAGASSEYVGDFNQYHNHNPPIQTHAYGIGIHTEEPGTFSQRGGTAPYNQNFEFAGQRGHWNQHEHPSHSQHYDHAYSHDDQSRRGSYWSQQDVPVSPAYPYHSLPSNDSIPAHEPGPHGYGLPRIIDGVPPMRSMSYNQVDSLAHDNDPYHHQGPVYEQQQSRAAEMLPPSLRHSASSSMVSINEVAPGTYAGVPTTTLAQAGGPSYVWGSPVAPHPSQNPKAGEGSGPWQQYSSEPQALAKVQEEQEGQMHFPAEPGVLYSNTPH